MLQCSHLTIPHTTYYYAHTSVTGFKTMVSEQPQAARCTILQNFVLTTSNTCNKHLHGIIVGEWKCTNFWKCRECISITWIADLKFITSLSFDSASEYVRRMISFLCCMLHSMHLYTCSPAQESQVIYNLHTREVPKELMISSNSLRLLHSVGEGTKYSVLYS